MAMNKIRRPLLTLAAAIALIGGLSGCSTGAAVTDSAPDAVAEVDSPGRVGVAEFAKVLEQKGIQILDVRTPTEFADGHIAGALNIPIQQPDFIQRVAQLGPKAAYAVYCRSGQRSKSAVRQMQGAGFAHIYELASGTNGWTAEGHPLVQ